MSKKREYKPKQYDSGKNVDRRKVRPLYEQVLLGEGSPNDDFLAKPTKLTTPKVKKDRPVWEIMGISKKEYEREYKGRDIIAEDEAEDRRRHNLPEDDPEYLPPRQYEKLSSENIYWNVRHTREGELMYNEFEKIVRAGKSASPDVQRVILSRQEEMLERRKRERETRRAFNSAASASVADIDRLAVHKKVERRLFTNLTLKASSIEILDNLKRVTGKPRGQLVDMLLENLQATLDAQKYERDKPNDLDGDSHDD